MNNIVFTRRYALNHQKASGSDGISAWILKVCSEKVADALVLIFSASINQRKIPDDWKHAIITPVYKGGNKNRTNPENYRPISLTSVTCKLMEHVIHSHIMKHLDRDQTLSNAQLMVFGSFTPARPNFCKLSTPSAHHSTTDNKSTLFCSTLVKPWIWFVITSSC